GGAERHSHDRRRRGGGAARGKKPAARRGDPRRWHFCARRRGGDPRPRWHRGRPRPRRLRRRGRRPDQGPLVVRHSFDSRICRPHRDGAPRRPGGRARLRTARPGYPATAAGSSLAGRSRPCDLKLRKNAPGLVPSDRSADPAPTASLHRLTRQSDQSLPGVASSVLARGFRTKISKKKTPAPEGPGSVAGWVRGWGLGGTPPGVHWSTSTAPTRSVALKLFPRCAVAAPAARARPVRQVERKIDVSAVGKLEVAGLHLQQAMAAPAALDDIAGADPEPGGPALRRRTPET